MQTDRCHECGRPMSSQRDLCPFCGWRERLQQEPAWDELAYRLRHPYPDQFRPEALPAL
jgi:RNA polymerase subunit RPABC4/transcription elongation factor Spt4